MYKLTKKKDFHMLLFFSDTNLSLFSCYEESDDKCYNYTVHTSQKISNIYKKTKDCTFNMHAGIIMRGMNSVRPVCCSLLGKI